MTIHDSIEPNKMKGKEEPLKPQRNVYMNKNWITDITYNKEILGWWCRHCGKYYFFGTRPRKCDCMVDKEKEETIKKCSDCYWYSDVTVQSCDKEYEPTKPDNPACDQFEQKR